MVFINIVTAKELKQRTGEIIKRIRAGEKLTITYRGRPVAAIIPISEKEEAQLNHSGHLKMRGGILKRL